MYSIIFSQGKFLHRDDLTFPFEERGLQFGDGVYEVIRVYNGKMHLLDEHVARLYRSLDAIKIKIDFTSEEIKSFLQSLLTRNNMESDGFIYLQVTRGSAERMHGFPENITPNIYAYVKYFPRPLKLLENGVKVITHRDERWENCYIKSLNLLPNVLARQTAHEQGAYEAILHRDELVTECSSGNIFIVKDGAIYTHPATNRILNGCVRQAVFRYAREANIPVYEEAFTLNDLAIADEIFLTSSLSEVMPVIQIDDMPIQNRKPGKITQKLQRFYEEDAQINDYARVNALL